MKSFLKVMAMASVVTCVHGQTQIDLQTQSKRVDFSAAASTKPFRTGTVLPAVCAPGELFFLLNAPVGSNVMACVATNTWAKQDGGIPSTTGHAGSVLATQDGQAMQWTPAGTTVQLNGTNAGTRTIQNYVTGFGLLSNMSDSGTAINIEQSINTAVVQTRSMTQAGTTLFCASPSGSGSVYTCTLQPTLTAYTSGMVLHWRPAANGVGGPTTIKIDSLGAVPLKQRDGVSDPGASEIVSGQLYTIWYDGSVFRLPRPGTNKAVEINNTPQGGVAATNLQAAINELDTKKASISTVQSNTALINELDTKKASISTIQSNSALYVTTTSGTGAEYQGSTTPCITTYSVGMVLYWKPNVNGTAGSVTINICGLGAKSIRQADGTDPLSTSIVAGRLYQIWYDGTSMVLPAVSSAAPTSPSSTAALGTDSVLTSIPVPSGIAGSLVSGVANQIRVLKFVVTVPTPVARIGVSITNTAAGGKTGLAIYRTDLSKVLDSGILDCSTGGNKIVALSSPVVLPVGTYYWAWATSNTAVQAAGIGIGSTWPVLLNGGPQVVSGTASAVFDSVTGMPANLISLTAGANLAAIGIVTFGQ